MELGVRITGSLTEESALAERAEERGLDLVVVDPAEGDPWTLLAWIAGRTRGIQLATATDAEYPYPAVLAKAHESLAALTGGRVLAPGASWREAAGDVSRDELRAVAVDGDPVVVPVTTLTDIDRLADLADELRGDQPHPKRPASVRSHRRPGIAYDGLPTSLQDTAVEPGDPAHRSVSATYMRGGSPGLVLRPRTNREVADALAFAAQHRHLPLGLRSGGHGISGRSTNHGGLVIDVGSLNAIEVVDPSIRRVRIGPGATWKQVARALDPYGLALGSGDYGGVGVGGLATAGGIGFLSREHGLTIDHLRAAELVLADGTSVGASDEEHQDLFWAVRGAGANLGVATAFEFEADKIGPVGFAQLAVAAADAETLLNGFGKVATAAPRDTTVFLVTGRPRAGQAVGQLYGVVDSDDPETIIERLTPFASIGQVIQQQIVLTRYTDVMDQAPDRGPDGHHGYGETVARSGFINDLTPEFARDAAALLTSGEVHFFQLRTVGGAVSDVPPEATAYAHRDAAFSVVAMGSDHHRLDPLWDAMSHHFDGLYLSFETDLRPERLHDAFPPATLARLRAIKRRYDPTNLFRDNFNIDPKES